MLHDDTILRHGAPQKAGSLTPLEWAERCLIFLTAIGFSNLFVFLLVGAVAEKPTAIAVDPGPLARLSWYPIYLSVLILMIWRWKAALRALPHLAPVLALLGIAILSISWSIDADLTQRRVIALAFTMMFGIYLAIRGPLVDTLRILGNVWLILTLIGLLIVFLMPSIGKHVEIHVGAWRGFMGAKNQFGGEMARANILFSALLFYDDRNRRKWWFGFILTTICVLGSTSKTSLLAMLLSWGVIFTYYLASRSRLVGLLAVWGAFSVAGIGYFILTAFPEQVVKLIGKDLTFTGRTEIWSLALHVLEDAKWTGFGYGAFWLEPVGPAYIIRDVLDWTVPTAHNGWIEVALAMGYPGLFLIIGATLIALVRMLWIATGQHGALPFVFLFQIILFSLSESILMEQNTYITGLFMFCLAYGMISRRVPMPDTRKALSTPGWTRYPRTRQIR